MNKRRNLKIYLAIFAVIFVAAALVDALDLFSNKDWGEVPHGNHSHFVPYNKDPDVDISSCPQHPPADDEILSRQCQLIQLVKVDGTTHYVPENHDPNVPPDRFPTRPPGSGVIITPTGELAAAGSH